jgi:hypothetical protein
VTMATIGQKTVIGASALDDGLVGR